MALTTAQDFADLALRALRVVDENADPTTAQRTEAIDVMQAMLGNWHADGLLKPGADVDVFTATGQTSYSWGSGGDINSARPDKLLQASYGNGERLEIIDRDRYESIQNKGNSTEPAKWAYYDPTYPTGTLYVWPVTTQVLRLVSIKPFTEYTAAATVTLPPIFKEALYTNLAVKLAPFYKVQPNPDIANTAMTSLAKIRLLYGPKDLTIKSARSDRRGNPQYWRK